MPTILITGASGFIGQLLATHLLTTHETASQNILILTDIIKPPIPPRTKYPQNATSVQADLCDTKSLSTLLSSAGNIDTLYIFHGIMSSGSENDFELGMRVNLHSTLALLEGVRTTDSLRRDGRPVRVIYASSLAVYGRPLPDVVSEETRATPEGSYGAQKLACEGIILDYLRRGYIDGLCLRFPTVSIRPGAPAAAASSFLSGVIREPMQGRTCVVPIVDRGFVSWMCSPRVLAENLMVAMGMELRGLERHRRVVNLPGTATSVQEMLDVLRRVGGEDKLRFVREVEDEGLVKILRSWGTRYDIGLALKLGFRQDDGFEQAVRDYVQGLKSEE
ncbi:hypothetical protein EYC80_003462 [Monilinia laxa]|uniref:NAD-dependent epimerase/dehydratase domain-containing protein n=1 Tax=Monilinia laxa TaxID=61186 RepID=A0A5N6KE30_MONLA|nr:hypothetical protein EYC80_003462 [Monilinia laxa]